MSLLHQMNEWSSKHHPKWLVVLRAVLGMCLFIQGVGFIQNNVILTEILSQSAVTQKASWLSTLIPWLHLLGGTMILVGLFTRFWCLVQVPVLAGAVVFVNVKQGLFTVGSDFLFSVIILILLIFFFIEGGGPLSLDHFLRSQPKTK